MDGRWLASRLDSQGEKAGLMNYWDASLEDTVQRAGMLARRRPAARDVVDWLSLYNEDTPTSSNQGTGQLPFQRWFRFKEAFSPKFVADTIASLPYTVDRVIDPFGGSGTTALTCGFLGANSVSIEVNPFLADLIASKVAAVRPSELLRQYEHVRASLEVRSEDRVLPAGMPVTMREPGRNDRWLFAAEVFDTIRALMRGLAELPTAERRLLRVLLGSTLVNNSNMVINGKGRRYRGGWQGRKRSAIDLLDDLDRAVDNAASDLTRFSVPVGSCHDVWQGDARALLANVDSADLAIFSPPYPNSFDYTDVYNVELWMLGYLQSADDNRRLRLSTLRSHVQIGWRSTPAPSDSRTLHEVLKALDASRGELWNRRIPEMVASYFDDMRGILSGLARILPVGRHAVCAIGDSQYAGTHIDVARIIEEMLPALGFALVKSEPIRSMRNSSQHGGSFDLREHCLVMERSR